MSELPRFIRNRHLDDKITVGLDSRRIFELVDTAMFSIDELLEEPEYGPSLDKMWKDLTTILTSNTVALTRVNFQVPNSVISDMALNIDLRRRKISILSKRQPKKRALINSVLRGLR